MRKYRERSKEIMFEKQIGNLNNRLVTNEKNVENYFCKITTLVEYIRCYTQYHDDEIVNWTLPDIEEDLLAGLFNTLAGFYKSSGSIIRNAFETNMQALYYQINDWKSEQLYEEFGEEQVDIIQDTLGNNKFNKWSDGIIDSEPWRVISKFVLEKIDEFNKIKNNKGIDFKKKIKNHYRLLCSYTHTRGTIPNSIDIVKDATSVANMCGEETIYLERSLENLNNTIAYIALLWSLLFPDIYKDICFNIKFRKLFTDEMISVFEYLS